MSVVAARLAGIPPIYMPWLDKGVSSTAVALVSLLEGQESRSNSWTDGRSKRAKDEVIRAVNDARVRGLMVDQHAAEIATTLLSALPSHVPLPDIMVEEDAHVVLDWNEESDRVVTVSVGENGWLGFSVLVGPRSDYGRAPFIGAVPDQILRHLLRLYPVSAGASVQR